jgi:hypothetical protein
MFCSKNTMAVVALSAVNKDVLGFDPRSIGGCALWLDAADTTTLTLSGTSVTSWRDKSGFGRNANAGTAPTYNSATSSVNFVTASSTYLTTSLSSGVNQEIIYMVTSGLIAGVGVSIMSGDPFNTNRLIQLSQSKIITVRINISEFLNSTVSLGTGRNIVCSENPGTNVTGSVVHYVNGTSAGGVNGTVSAYSTGQTSVIGCQAASAGGYVNFITANIHEFIVFQNVVLTARQRQSVEGYLAWKWGLQANLPVTHPFRQTFPRGVRFNPLSLNDCFLWIDAADRSTVTTSGSTVTAVRDKSGRGNNSTSVTNTITYLSNGINSLPVFNFNATPVGGFQRIVGPVSNTTTTLTVYNVCSVNSTSVGANGRIISLSLPSQTFDYDNTASVTMTQVVSQANVNTTRFNRNIISSLHVPITIGTPFVWGVVFDGTNGQQYRNGTGFSSVSNSSTTSAFGYTTYAIGDTAASTSSASPFFGYVGEVLIFNKGLTPNERILVEGYLAQKWGLRTSLPSTHPFFYATNVPQINLFAPNQLTSTLTAWFDGRDPNNDVATVPADGSILATWTDKSGNGNNGTGVNNPTYSLINKGVQLVSTSSQYYSAAISSSLSTETVIGVFRLSSLSERALIGPSGGSGGRQIGTRLVGSDWRLAVARAGVSYVLTNTSVALATNTVYLFTYTAAAGLVLTLSLYGGTAASASGVAAFTGTTSTQICAYNGAALLDATIHELVFFPSTLSTNDIQRIEGYLAWKWSLNGNLPVTHPYYRVKP